MMPRGFSSANAGQIRRGLTLSWLVLFVLSILLQYGSLTNPQSALAVHDEGLFELDGNAVDSGAAGDDWDDVYGGTSNADSTQFIVDPVDDNNDETFTGGSTKDDQPIGNWLWKHFKASQAKNDITHAFAAAYTNADNHSIIYFGLNKYEADGDNFVGFWFVQDQIGLTGSGNAPGSPFVGEHVVGDILVLADYTNGGALATFSVFRWVGSGGDANASGTLDTVASGVPCTGGTGDLACGSTNGANEDSPWPFTARDADLPAEADTFLPGTFFEGGIDLTGLGIDEGCFSTFIAETRASQSVDATLSDFAMGSFSFCHEPDLSTQVSADQISVGDDGVTDTAHLESSGDPVTTGTVDFFLCGPTAQAQDCNAPDGVAAGSDVPDANGDSTSDLVSPTETGFYCFRAEYTPEEGSKLLATDHTNDTTECFEVVVGEVDLVKVASPVGPVTAGDEIGFDITVTNIGDGNLYDVHLSDPLPAGVDWDFTDPTGDTDGVTCDLSGQVGSESLTCDDPSMAPDDSFVVHVFGDTGAEDCGTIDNTAFVTTGNDGEADSTAIVTINCPNVWVTKVADADPINAGDTASFTIEFGNDGVGDAYDVHVEDQLPEDDWTLGGADAGDCSIDGSNVLSCDFDVLLAGDSRTITVSRETTADDCGLIENDITIEASNEPAGADGDNSSGDDITVNCAAILIIKSADDTDVVVELEKIGFTVTVSNTGGDAYDVHVNDPLPAGFNWVLDPASDPGWSIVAGVLVFDAPILASGASSSAHVTSVTDRGDCGPVHNVASVITSNDGSDVDDADATVRCPTLFIDKSYAGNTGGTASNGTGIAKVGDTLTYTLAYDLTNGPVTHGVITDTLPNGLAYVVGSATNNDEFTFVSYDAATRTLTWTAPTVTKDGSVTYKVTVLAGSFNLPQPLVNTATIDSDQTVKDDDTASVLVQVVLAETSPPTLPPTDTIDSGGSEAPGNPGFGLMLALLAIAGIGLLTGYVTPVAARNHRKEARRR